MTAELKMTAAATTPPTVASTLRTGSKPRVLVVSHPSVVSIYQAVYAELLKRGWDIVVVVPDRWRGEFERGEFRPKAFPGLEERLRYEKVLLPGRPQRHFYIARVGALVRHFQPDVAFVESECFSIPAAQWGQALARAEVPFGVQAYENLDRPLPVPAKAIRAWVLRHADFVAARSPAAGETVQRWGARGRVELVPYGVPDWNVAPRRRDGVFTVGFAGRLVPQKGVLDLVDACLRVQGPLRLLIVGDGPLRPTLEHMALPEGEIEFLSDLGHSRMPEAYAEMDVLVLPSRTTRKWAEQFGRVLVEALSCGVPIVGSDSGEIPWVIESTSGGLVFPEGDIESLAGIIGQLRADPERRASLARTGREGARRLFSVVAAADALEAALHAAVRSDVGESR